MKGLWYFIDSEPWGHSVRRLVEEFPCQNEIVDFQQWLKFASLLDQFYIPTRHPNGLPDLTPGQVYEKEDAQRAMTAAQELVSKCKKWIEEHE